MIKKTLYFGNPAYLSLRMEQMVIKLPEVEKAYEISEVTKQQSVVTRPIEDIGIVVLDNKQIKKITKLKDKELYAALGWLARENKIYFEESGDGHCVLVITNPTLFWSVSNYLIIQL